MFNAKLLFASLPSAVPALYTKQNYLSPLYSYRDTVFVAHNLYKKSYILSTIHDLTMTQSVYNTSITWYHIKTDKNFKI